MINSDVSLTTLQANLALSQKRGEPFTISSSDVASVLSAFLVGDISERDLVKWADFLDGNEDVEFEPNRMIPDVLFELSSPEINGRLEEQRARELLILMS